MKWHLLSIALLSVIITEAQVTSKKPLPKTVVSKLDLSPAAKIIFRDIKTTLSNEEKNYFSKGAYVRTDDKNSLTPDDKGEDMGVFNVEIYPTDLNKDGIEEIFMRTSGTYFGQWLQDLQLYIKNQHGKYVLQDAIASPRLYLRATSFGGYPDLIGGQPEGPGFNHSVAKIDTYRWNGNAYQVYKKNQVKLSTDKSVEEVISPAYGKTIAAVVTGNDKDYTIASFVFNF